MKKQLQPNRLLLLEILMNKTLSIFAPAKINLYLHITGKLDNGYHMIDSVAGFVDIGDYISLEKSDGFSFEVTGPYKDYFSERDLDPSPQSGNLVVRAFHRLSQATGKSPDVHITLQKNLPLASGIGGGSSDAGACIWGLMELWKVSPVASYLPSILLELGTDVPVCLKCQPSHMAGLGDLITPIECALPEVPIVLINPMIPCPTSNIYKSFNGQFSPPPSIPEYFSGVSEFIDFLEPLQNDLTNAAIDNVPEIKDVVACLSERKGLLLSRMSGSGATCFGLFSSNENAKKAALDIKGKHPDWWVQSGHLNRPQRY